MLIYAYYSVKHIAIKIVTGAIRDLSNSYTVAFYSATSIYAIIFVMWSLELFIKNKRKKIMKTSKSSQLNKIPK